MKPDIEAIKKRLDKATRFPWKEHRKDNDDLLCAITGQSPCGEAWVIDAQFLLHDDAEFIINSRQDIPDLLGYIELLESEIKELKNASQSL
jgi:hypothetical protein